MTDSQWDYSWLDRYEGFSGGAQLQLELMQPFNLYDMAVNPSNETVTKAAYMPAIGYTSYWLTTKILGESMPGFWVRAGSRYHDIRMMVQTFAPHAARALYVSAPIVLAAGSAGAQAYVWSEIGDSKTGAVHYSSAGMMSGGSMPVVTGTLGDLPTWSDIKSLW
jgi:hypothetical protein